jgi:hypothetical protein
MVTRVRYAIRTDPRNRGSLRGAAGGIPGPEGQESGLTCSAKNPVTNPRHIELRFERGGLTTLDHGGDIAPSR